MAKKRKKLTGSQIIGIILIVIGAIVLFPLISSLITFILGLAALLIGIHLFQGKSVL